MLWIVFFALFSLKAFASCDLGLLENDAAKKYHYIIVPGILNEIVPYYMTEYRRRLLSLGVPADQITRLNNATLSLPEESAVGMMREISKINTKHRLVFLAHSKGALETLYLLLNNKKKVNLERAFLIQGALDGSSLYRVLVAEQRKGSFFSLVQVLRSWPYIKNFSDSLGFDMVRKKLAGISKELDLLKKITFIETDKSYEGLSFKFKTVGGIYRDSYNTPGDGVLLRSDHLPFELKEIKNLCRHYYKADHGDLVKAAPWEKERTQRIEGFLNEILFGFKRN